MEINNSHSRLITIFNDEYIKMIGQNGNSNKPNELEHKPDPKSILSNRKQRKNMVGKFRKFIPGQKVFSDSTLLNVKTKTPYDTAIVNTIEPLKVDPGTNPINNGGSKESKKSLVSVLKDISWWEPPEESLSSDFCRDTSLHGLKYLTQSKRHLSERIFWMVAFLSGLILATVLISDVWNKYNSSPIIVSFQSYETSVDEVPFPAVTICNMNKVLKSKAESYINQAEGSGRTIESLEDVFYLDHVCGATKSFTKQFNYSYGRGFIDMKLFGEEYEQSELTKVNEFLRKASQNCSDMIPLCMWQGEVYNCSHLFRPIETEFGKCCTFNMVPQSVLYTLRNDERDDQEEIKQWHQWNLDTDGLLLTNYKNDFPRRQMQAGKTFGLSILLNPAIHEYFCTTSDSTGFRLATHLPIDTPHVTDFGISIRPKAEVFVNVKPEITMVDQSIFKFKIETRRCYRIGEFSLKYYKFYTPSNCVNECIANKTLEECDCVRYYMPRDENQTLCGGNQTSFECAENVILNMTKKGARSECNACYPSCSEVEYQSQTTTTPLQSGIWVDRYKTTSIWEKENVSIVHIFFGQDTTYARVRKELFGSTDLFANTGGLMGLCLGFSGLSLMEVIYFMTLRAYWTYRRKKNVRERVAKRFKDAWAKAKNLRFRKVLDKEKSQPVVESESTVENTFFHTPQYKQFKPDGNISDSKPPRLHGQRKQKSDVCQSAPPVNYKNILGDV